MKKLIAGIIIGFLLGSFALVYADDALQAIKASFPILVNGKTFATDKPIVTINGSTYMPLRAIGDALGVKVNWNNDLKRVEIGDATTSDSTSFDSPSDLNTLQSIAKSDMIDNYKAEITVKEIVRGDNAWSMIQQANKFNEAPKTGYEYILAKINFKLTDISGGKQFNLNSVINFKLVSQDGKEYDYANVVAPDPQLDCNLYKGASNEGWAAFLVKQDDLKPRLVFGKNYDGTGGVWFKTYNN